MSGEPRRVQLSRRKGWRMPENTISVARPNRHGNPFCIGDFGIPDAASAVERFREWRDGRVVGPDLPPVDYLRGKNLACWCPLCEAHKDGKPFGVQCPDCSPCHADVLLEIANARASQETERG